MTRAELAVLISGLDAAAQARGHSVRSVIGDGASEEDISHCESALGIHLPAPYRDTLAQWNGCEIQVCEQPADADKETYRALFTILSTQRIVPSTQSFRDVVTRASRDSTEAQELISRAATITYDNDIAVFLTCGIEPTNLTVRYCDIEYVFSEHPTTFPVIAASPDEYIEKCLAQLAKTLETEIYW